jgi:hypothetical protein
MSASQQEQHDERPTQLPNQRPQHSLESEKTIVEVLTDIGDTVQPLVQSPS